MLIKAIQVVNYSEHTRELADTSIPGGRVKLEPGATYFITPIVWQRICRKCSSWLRRANDSSVVTTESITKQKPETQEPADTPLEKRSMDDVKALAAEHGITFKVGMSKADLIAAIREATAADIQEVKTNED